ncbi:hypothetical protein [Synechococcus elongatus]|uniref:Uncharacterized protein n=2 Tax=Synechococcus elongatus TaxID=32046 RepID=A0AAQ3MCI7_SYNEL
MGSAVPVLLIVVDLITKRTFFICLNDYIDKILVPEDINFFRKKYKTLRIPVKNEILNQKNNLVALRAYGKRAKMYGAFNKFYFQKKEIDYLLDSAQYGGAKEADIETIHKFTETLLRQDIWRNHEFWGVIKYSFDELNNLKYRLDKGVQIEEYQDILDQCGNGSGIWHRLVTLGNIYEEIVRERFMPTYLAQHTSYP